jgi:hypothetical protein
MAFRNRSWTAVLRRPAVSLALALVAAVLALEPLVTIAQGASAPGWAHWLCSPATLRSAVHTVGASRVGPTLLSALEVHWPHFLPILVGLGTLIYLWRANARFRAQEVEAVND